MSYFIVINGPLGSGKSTVAKKLASLLSAKQIKLDEVLSENKLDQLKPNSACIPAENFIKAIDIAIPTAVESLDKNQIVIFDGCFYHKRVMDYLIEELKYTNYIFTLEAPLEVCIERDKNREKTLGKDAAEAVFDLVSDCKFGIIINANKDFDRVIDSILSHLPSS